MLLSVLKMGLIPNSTLLNSIFHAPYARQRSPPL
jgi:hypothetical protein